MKPAALLHVRAESPKVRRDGVMSVSKRIVDALSHRTVRGGCYVLAFVFFFLIVLIPTVSVLSYLFTDWGAIQTEVFARPDRMALIYHALFLSFAVAGEWCRCLWRRKTWGK